MIELLYLFILFRIAKNNNFSIFKKYFQKSTMSLIEYVKMNFFQLNFSQSLINLSLVLFSVSYLSFLSHFQEVNGKYGTGGNSKDVAV